MKKDFPGQWGNEYKVHLYHVKQLPTPQGSVNEQCNTVYGGLPDYGVEHSKKDVCPQYLILKRSGEN